MSETGDDGFDPQADLLDRYERMIDIQIETIDGIDDKAAHTARLIGLLGGLILTAVSVAVSTDAITFSEGTAMVFLMLGIGTVALFASFVFAIITYLSSKFAYGPSSDFNKTLSNNDLSPEQYHRLMLAGYSSGIKANKQVVEINSDRFKRCLASLIVALLYFFAAGVLIVLPDGALLDFGVGFVFSLTAVLLSRYVLRKEYLTLEGEGEHNERV